MTNQFCTHDDRLVSQAQNSNDSHSFSRTPLAHSIRNLIALGGLTLVSSATWADVHINPNEIWLEPGWLKGICAQDMDQDGDIDLFHIHEQVVRMLENIGTPESPKFALPVDYSNDTGILNLNRLGLSDCRYYDDSPVSVDIDADGDLDLFTSSHQKLPSGSFDFKLEYARNDGTTEHPNYFIVTEHAQELFGLPDHVFRFMFKDLDNDGDKDFLNGSSPVYSENIGTPQQANFVQRDEYLLQSFCDDSDFLVDLNNDGQWDILCRNFEENTFEYVESSREGYLPKKNLFTDYQYRDILKVQALDIDHDGDMDIMGVSVSVSVSENENNFILYTNIGSSILPIFDRGSIYTTTSVDFPAQNLYVSDIDTDGDLDAIGYTFPLNDDKPESFFLYIINTGSNMNQVYDISTTAAELQQCHNSLYEIADLRRVDPNNVSGFQIADVTLVDIDGDNDLDLFSQLKLLEKNIESRFFSSSRISVYCENQGNTTSPLFVSGIANPFGLIPEPAGSPDISFGDIDGDGDQDARIGIVLYDNIGNSKQPLFRQISYTSIATGFSSVWADMDGDGQIDSALDASRGLRLLYKGLEPALHVAATSIDQTLILAAMRPSQVQLQSCSPTKYWGCGKKMALATTPRELSLSTGDFNADGFKDIVLAMIDAEGKLDVQIYNTNFELIGSSASSFSDSVSVSAGQLDDDPADEYVVSFVQPDGRVAAIAFNLDGSQISKVVAKQGTKPSVDIGKFNDKGHTYVLAYINTDNQLETATFSSDGTLIAQSGGGMAHHVSVNAVDLLSNIAGDEYVTAVIQADETAALIGFAADGTRLGKVVSGVSQQPNVKSGIFPGSNDTGLAVSLIQSDQKPAIIFLDNLGNYLATGVGGKEASASNIALFESHEYIDDVEQIIDIGVLLYIDKAGIIRWDVFGADGVKVPYGW